MKYSLKWFWRYIQCMYIYVCTDIVYYSIVEAQTAD